MNRFEVFNKYLSIKQDLLYNLEDVYNRENHFSKKYRGNLHTDINVTVQDIEASGNKSIQIFVRHNEIYIKDNIIFNLGGYYESKIKTNLHEGDN